MFHKAECTFDFFDFHGVRLRVESRLKWIRELTGEGLDLLKIPGERMGEDIRVCIGVAARRERDAELLFERRVPVAKGQINGYAQVWSGHDKKFLFIGIEDMAGTYIDFSKRTVSIEIYNYDHIRRLYDPLYTSSLFFKSFLLELFPLFGFFPLHASMCRYSETGIIITGPPGCGKTTLNLALVNRGMSFLADEIGFIEFNSRDYSHLALKAFPIHIKSWKSLRENQVPLVGRGSQGEYIYPAPVSEPDESFCSPDILIFINPSLKGKVMRQTDEFTALESLLIYDVFYSQMWEQLELDLLDQVASHTRAWEISGEMAATSPAEICDLIRQEADDV